MRPGSEFGCSSTREGSGVSGCLQRRERIADAAKPRVKRRRLRGLTVSSFGSGHFLSYLGAGVSYLRAEGVGQHTKQRSGTRRGEPPATGMARDYDYLFKLLIIGDSGKSRPGMQDGKWALMCVCFLQGQEKECRTGAALNFHDSFSVYCCFYRLAK